MLTLFISSAVCLIGGIWLGKNLTDRRWRDNALKPYHIEHDGLLYKVHCEQQPKQK